MRAKVGGKRVNRLYISLLAALNCTRVIAAEGNIPVPLKNLTSSIEVLRASQGVHDFFTKVPNFHQEAIVHWNSWELYERSLGFVWLWILRCLYPPLLPIQRRILRCPVLAFLR